MRRPKRIRLLVLAVLVLGGGATLIRFALNSLNASSQSDVAGSMTEAKSRGILVCQLFPENTKIPWEGDVVEISEAWVEWPAQEKHFLVWWKYYQPTRTEQFISLRLNKDVSRLRGFSSLTFGIQQAGHEGFVPMVDDIRPGSNSRYFTSIDNLDPPEGLTLVIYGPLATKYLAIPLRR